MDSFCYICYEEETKHEKFIRPNICKCKNLRIHKKCFIKLQSNALCSVCKNFYDTISLKIDRKVNINYTFGYCEKYNVNRKGKITGLYKSYYPNGQIYIHTFYKNGKKHGCSQIFYSNGNLKEFGFYNEDLLNGKYYKYYDNNIMEEISEYKNGILEGTCMQKYRNGKIKYAMQFKNNKLCTLVHLYPNESLHLRCTYKNELLDGNYTKYDEKYTLIYDNVYKNGEFLKIYKEKKYNLKDFLFQILCLLILLFHLRS
jgi:antitoxin component YwqK of YwqJK toxin-antitoxin module